MSRDNKAVSFFRSLPLRFMCLSVVFVVLFCGSGPASAANWYDNAVTYTIENKYMQGMGAEGFVPFGIVTRAQLVQVLYNLAGRPDVENQSTFQDVGGHWAEPAVDWAYENDITDGVSETEFGPNSKLTREQLAKFFWSFWNYDSAANAFLIQPDVRILNDIPDRTSISSWAQEYVLWARQVGLLNGDENGNVTAKAYCNRAQLAQILKNYCETVRGLEPQPYLPSMSEVRDGRVYTVYGTDVTGISEIPDALESELITQINYERTENGLPELERDTRAQLAADVRCREMVPIYSYYVRGDLPEWWDKEYRSMVVHFRGPWKELSEFSSMDEFKDYWTKNSRHNAYVYSAVCPVGCIGSTKTIWDLSTTECGLVSYRGKFISFAQQASKWVDAWMNSDGHRASLLDKNVKYIGVGVVRDETLDSWTCAYVAYSDSK